MTTGSAEKAVLFVELYIKTAKKSNVKFSFYNPVIDIKKKNGLFRIVTEKVGVFTAEVIILAGDPWIKELRAMLDIDILVSQVRGEILITEPLSPLFRHTIAGIRQTENGEVLLEGETSINLGKLSLERFIKNNQ